jgi:hypothetical protein
MKLITYFSPLSTKTYAWWLLVSKLTTRKYITPTQLKVIFYPNKVFFLIEPRWFFICGGEWRKPILCTVRIPTLGAPGQGQTLDVYLRPVYWVRPRHILRWWLATSLPHGRTAGPNAGLHVSTYVLGIGQTNTSGSNRIDRYSLWKSPPRASFRVVHSKSHKIHFGAL